MPDAHTHFGGNDRPGGMEPVFTRPDVARVHKMKHTT